MIQVTPLGSAPRRIDDGPPVHASLAEGIVCPLGVVIGDRSRE
jgi:hypothetical protein